MNPIRVHIGGWERLKHKRPVDHTDLPDGAQQTDRSVSLENIEVAAHHAQVGHWRGAQYNGSVLAEEGLQNLDISLQSSRPTTDKAGSRRHATP